MEFWFIFFFFRENFHKQKRKFIRIILFRFIPIPICKNWNETATRRCPRTYDSRENFSWRT